MFKFSRLFGLVLILWFVRAVYAQYPQTSDTATGLSPMAVYNVGDIDNVNPANGNLFLQIPLLSYPQRGKKLSLNFRIYYNAKTWFLVPIRQITFSPSDVADIGMWSWYATPSPQSGQVDNIGVYVARDQLVNFGTDSYQWSVSGGENGGYTVTTNLYGYYVASADGAKHYYGDWQTQSCGQQGGGTCPPIYDGYESEYISSNGAGYLPLNFGLLGGSSVVDANGVTYALSSGRETIKDPSGNTVTVNGSGWQDTLDRNIPGGFTTLGYNGFGGSVEPVPGVPVSVNQTTCPSAGTYAARQWTVPSVGSGATQTYYLCYQQFSYQTAFDYPGNQYGVWASAEESSSSSTGHHPAVLLSAIMLPNGTSYSFSYDSYLSLSSLTLPTGATISYTWQNVTFLNPSVTSPISRALQTRTVNPKNGPTQTWQYQWVASDSGLWSIVTDPNHNDVEYQIGGQDDSGQTIVGTTITRQMYYTGCGAHDTGSGRTCSGGSGQPIKTVSYILAGNNTGGSDLGTPSFPQASYQPTTTTTTLQTGAGANLVSKVVTNPELPYGSCNIWQGLGQFSGSLPAQPSQKTIEPCYSINEPQSVSYYDYGSGGAGALLKTVTTNYLWQSSSAYLSANFMNLQSSVVTSDGTGTKAAETDYFYDQSPSPSGTLGNLTSVVQWLKGGTSLTTSTAYNIQGMPTSTTDANLNTTTIAYDGTGAFPLTVTFPKMYGVVHADQYVFDSNTGLETSHTDWNQNVTTYSYINSITGKLDPLNRLGQITFPMTTDGTTGNQGQGYKKYFFNDTPGSLSVTEQDLESTNGTLIKHESDFDGLGRVYQSLTTSDPYGKDEVDTTYDLLGRVASVSNPYRPGIDTVYSTSYTYDAIDRMIIQTQPDGGIQQWCYNDVSSGQSNCQPNKSSKVGTWVDVADENGNDWQQVGDGLNRMEAAMEPNGTSWMETDYGYDANGNLTSAKQLGTGTGSISRSFAYDTVSRLLAANNPENASAQYPASLTCPGVNGGSWTTYGYDANGNLTSKKDNRSITVSYAYDTLNRMAWKHYSDGVTAPAGFGYDGLDSTGHALSGETNAVGRLSQTSVVAANAISIFSYDPMGRVTKKESCIPGDCSYDVKLNATYDLMGNLASLSNGSPTQPITLSYTYDAADRLASITSSWTGGSNHPATLLDAKSTSPAAYSAVGLVYALMGGTTSSSATVVESRAYDNRLRSVYEDDVSKSGTTIYSYCIPGPKNSYCSGASGFAANGNLQQVTDSVMGSWTFQSPGYDTLNRMVNGKATTGPYINQYGCWQYDAFGNRLSEAVSATACTNSPTPSSWAHYNANNQISSTGLMPAGDVYDAAGNVLNDGVNQYLYDGEGRLCAEKSSTGALTGYIYDAAGNRVGKGTIGSFSCSVSVAVTSGYVVVLDGEQLTETNGGTGWVHTHVYAEGRLLATYTSSDTLFELNDWLGTKRAEAGVSGCVSQWESLPFGNALTGTGSCSDTSEIHFTGKERDVETGNDYFGARFYASMMGRFISPDYDEAGDTPEPVPYADFGNPQSMNLYSYVWNRSTMLVDYDGHTDCGQNGSESTKYDNKVVDHDSWRDPPCPIQLPAFLSVPGGPSFGSGSTNTRIFPNWAPSKPGCQAGPLNISQNIQTAKALAGHFWSGLLNSAYQGGAASAGAAAGTYVGLVQTGGAWDPKNGPGGATAENVAAGNINFGATCSQFGFNTWLGGQVCQYGAGIYGKATGNYGSSIFSKYHGDWPSDNAQIRQGLTIAKKGGC